MIEIYYTTSNQNGFGLETTENKVKDSIGGYKSSSIVPNDSFGNLFPDVSLLSGTNDKYLNSYVALVLYNNSDSAKENLNIWVEKEEEDDFQSSILLSLVTLTEAGYMERIPNQYSKPMYSSFEEYDSESKLVIESLEAGSFLGLWIQRKLLSDVIEEQYNLNLVSDDTNAKLLKDEGYGTTDEFSLNVEWDD